MAEGGYDIDEFNPRGENAQDDDYEESTQLQDLSQQPSYFTVQIEKMCYPRAIEIYFWK